MAKYPPESKVIASTGTSGLAALFGVYTVWQLGVTVFGASADADKAVEAAQAVPYPVSGLILALLPVLGAAIGGYLAPHSPRAPEPAEVIVPGPLN